jgi:hypothetical protein
MRRQSAFEIYLRTGLLPDGCSEPVEVKFNPWHDSKNGRFTFAGQGNSSGGGTQSNGSASTARKRNTASSFGQFSPRNPRNYSIHSVRRGETLTGIATTRKGLFVDIIPHYRGTSKRPYLLTITWFTGDQRFSQIFQNERRGR